MSEEFLDVVNEKDEVIGKAAYKDIYAKKLTHRIVHVLLFNDKGEMALQLRSKTKSFCPGHWSTAVGGHVQSGESFEQAAMREMQEEVGIQAPVSFAFKDWYSNVNQPNLFKFLGTFTAQFNGPFTLGLEEVEAVEFFPLSKIKQMIETGEKFHPELLYILEKHYF